MQLNNSKTFKGLNAPRVGRLLFILGFALGASACSSESDELRDAIPQTGVAAAVQIDLPRDSQQAQVAATVYKDAVAQPLVGGDVLQARTDQSLVTLRALENLGGHYTGSLVVDHPDTPVDVAVNYDPQSSVEERWFGSDELLVEPGPGSLVGYAVTGMQFPAGIAFESPANRARYATRADEVMVNWTPVNAGDQVRLTASVACHYSERTVRYALTRNIGIEGEDAAADGSYSMIIDDFVEVAPLVATLASIEEYISVFVSAIVFGLEPNEFLAESEPVMSPGQLDGCDIDLALLREKANPLPPEFSGGYAITSRSDTIRIVYAP